MQIYLKPSQIMEIYLKTSEIYANIFVNSSNKCKYTWKRQKCMQICLKSPAISYLIFVIFFTQAKFLEYKIYTEKRVNYNKLHSELPILRVNYDKLHSKLPILRVKSVKIYTGQKKFTRMPSARPWQIWGMLFICIKH